MNTSLNNTVTTYLLSFSLMCLAIAFIPSKTFAQEKNQFAVTVNFHSICCGVPSDKLLNKRISAFKIKYRIKKIEAVKIGPLGREGEYCIGFTLQEMNSVRKRMFIQMLTKTAVEMKDRGNANIETNVNPTSFENSGATMTPIFY